MTQYTTGTITVPAHTFAPDTTVVLTGNGTAWDTSPLVKEGYGIWFQGGGYYVITNIASATSMTARAVQPINPGTYGYAIRYDVTDLFGRLFQTAEAALTALNTTVSQASGGTIWDITRNGTSANAMLRFLTGGVGRFRFQLDASDNLVLERSTDGVVWSAVISFANADGAASIPNLTIPASVQAALNAKAGLVNPSFSGAADQPNIQLLTNSSHFAFLEVGIGRTSNGGALIDLVSDTTYTDFGTRLIRDGDPNGQTRLECRGTAGLLLRSVEAGPISLAPGGTDRLTASPVHGAYRTTPIAFRAERNAVGQQSATGKIDIQGVPLNNSSVYNSALSRFTAPIAGTYHLSASVFFGLPNVGSFGEAGFYRNGSFVSSIGYTSIPSGNLQVQHVSSALVFDLAANDYVEVHAMQLQNGATVWPSNYTTFSGFIL